VEHIFSSSRPHRSVAISFSKVQPFTPTDPDMGAGEVAPPTSHLSSNRVQIEVSPTGRNQLHNIFNFIMEKLLVRFPKVRVHLCIK